MLCVARLIRYRNGSQIIIFFLLDGAVNWQSIVGTRLVLYSATDGNKLVALAPVCWQALSQTVCSLRNYQEVKVAPLANHLPGIGTPQVVILHKEIGSKAGLDQRAGGDLVLSVSFPSDGHIKTFRLRYHRSVYVSSCIPTVYVTMVATLTQLVVLVPRIPKGRFLFDGIYLHSTCFLEPLPFQTAYLSVSITYKSNHY